MEQMSEAALELIAERFSLLANPSRLMLLQHICAQERTVSELVKLTGFKQANVSKQLGMLDRGGLVKRRVDGNRVFYVLADAALPRLCEVMQDSLAARQKELLRQLRGR
jgi:DNA-binding transcriptional ArsR family regulator